VTMKVGRQDHRTLDIYIPHHCRHVPGMRFPKSYTIFLDDLHLFNTRSSAIAYR